MLTKIYSENTRTMTLDEFVNRITKAGTIWNVDTIINESGVTVSCYKSKITEEEGSLYFHYVHCEGCRFVDDAPLVGIYDYRNSIEYIGIDEYDNIAITLVDGSVLSVVEYFI